jgi:N-acetylglutamate synthase-like GNAT family acetyltransferase
MSAPLPFAHGDAFELTEFLRSADLMASGVGEPDVRLWVDLDADGRIVASTGFELRGQDALLRCLAVHPSLRGAGRGTELARFAIEQAEALGAQRAWVLSRRWAPFWASVGFEPAHTAELATALADTHQVRALTESRLLRYETAWSRPLP